MTAPAFDWSQFQTPAPVATPTAAPPPENQPSPQVAPAPAAFDWSQFQTAAESPPATMSQEPDAGQETKRHILRSLSRAGETLAGLPGDIGNALFDVAEFFGADVKEARKELPFKTSAEFRDWMNEQTGGYTAAQTAGEQMSDDIVGLFTGLSLPGPGKFKVFAKSPFGSALRASRNLGIAVGTNLAGQGAEALGAEGGGQAAARVGTAFVLSMVNPKGANNFKNSLFEKADAARPKNAMVNAGQLSSDLKKFKAQLSKGGVAPSKGTTLSKLDELQGKIKNGKVPLEELTEFKKAINEYRAGLFGEFKSNKPGLKSAQKNLNEISSVVDSSLERYGKTNKAWYEPYKEANSVHGAIEDSKRVGRWVSRNLEKAKIPTALAPIAGALYNLKGTVITAGLSPIGIGAYKTAQIMVRIAKSPAMRQFYAKASKAALAEDTPAFIRELSNLQRELDKKEETSDIVSQINS